MTGEEWQKIKAAGKLLGLEGRVSLKEIKQAYRRLSKKHHPDTAAGSGGDGEAALEMHEITAAYQTLMDYCANYRYPLAPENGEAVDDEDWWMDRFGNDPLWGKG